MCRIASYLGPAIPLENIVVSPRHSLLAQSQNAAEGKLSVHGDGFGLAWYNQRSLQPGLFLDEHPAWADDNLAQLCRMVESKLFIAHVRAANMGETSRQNCHPFAYGKWSFCHNGQIPHFPTIRRQLEANLPDDLYAARRGSTDSEMLFLTLLAHGLDHDPVQALHRTIADVSSGDVIHPVKLTCVFSDGQSLYAFRYASRGPAPLLYVSGSLDNGGCAIASEPLTGVSDGWDVIPQNVLFRLDEGGVETLAVAA